MGAAAKSSGGRMRHLRAADLSDVRELNDETTRA